jgi:hypothetical protein
MVDQDRGTVVACASDMFCSLNPLRGNISYVLFVARSCILFLAAKAVSCPHDAAGSRPERVSEATPRSAR